MEELSFANAIVSIFVLDAQDIMMKTIQPKRINGNNALK
jgi:hypothetical protein